MSEDITTQFKTEGAPAFPIEDKENDNSADSSSGEETNIDESQSDEGDNSDEKDKDHDAGLADHPRWKKREADWTKRYNEQETRHTDELSKLREEFEQKIQGIAPKDQKNENLPVKVPAWFGGDEDQWLEFVSWNKQLAEEAQKGAVKEIDTRTETEKKAVEEATNYMISEIQKIESDGVKVDQNKLLKFITDNYEAGIQYVDKNGRWNYRAAWNAMKSTTQVKNNSNKDRKNLASATIDDKHAEDKPKNFATSADFQKPGGRPW